MREFTIFCREIGYGKFGSLIKITIFFINNEKAIVPVLVLAMAFD